MWMCWEPVHEQTHLGGLWRFPRALVLTEDVSGSHGWGAGSGTWFCTKRWRPGGRQDLASLRRQNQARSSRPAAAGGRAEQGSSTVSSSPTWQVPAMAAQWRQDPLQKGHLLVFPGLWLLQGWTLEKAGLGTTLSRASLLSNSAQLCLFSHATLGAGCLDCDTGSSWRRGCLIF